MKPLSIGEIAKRTGLRTSALRYEDEGILPKPGRVSGQRRYDPETIHHVEMLRFAQPSVRLPPHRGIQSLACGHRCQEGCNRHVWMQ